MKDLAGNSLASRLQLEFQHRDGGDTGQLDQPEHRQRQRRRDQSVNGTSVTVQGAGTDIWNSADSFRYAYQPVSGDVVLTAKVTQWVGGGNSWRRAG